MRVHAPLVFSNNHEMVGGEVPRITQSCSAQGCAIGDEDVIASTRDYDVVAALSPSLQVTEAPALLEMRQGINETTSDQLSGHRRLPCRLGELDVRVDVAEDPWEIPGVKSKESLIDVVKCLQILVRRWNITTHNVLPPSTCHYHKGQDVSPMAPERFDLKCSALAVK